MKHEPDETLEAKITRIADVMEIQQVQHTYQHWLSLLDYEKILEQFARHEKSTIFGQDVKDFFKRYTMMRNFPGILIEHFAICPVIEVAKDGKTAKGTWFSPGIILMGPVDGQSWAWGKYTAEYIKEDGEWKIWHLDYFETFGSDVKKGPLAEQDTLDKMFAEATAKGIMEGRPHKRRKKIYSPNEVNRLSPEPPEPYDTM